MRFLFTIVVYLFILSFASGQVTDKQALLDKASGFLIWFREADNNDLRAGLRVTDFRKRITPFELVQASTLLAGAKQNDTANMLLDVFPKLEASPYECYEIVEQLSDNGLDTLNVGGAEHPLLAALRRDADVFMKTLLTPAEKVALYNDPQTPVEIMNAVVILAGTPHPQIARSYLKKFNALELSNEDAAAIVDSVGSTILASIAVNGEFAPMANTAMQNVFAKAREYWAEPQSIKDAIDRIAGSEIKTSDSDVTVVWRGGELSVPMVIERFATASDDEAKELIALLKSLGKKSCDAVVESLRSDNEKVVQYAAQALHATLPAEDLPQVFALALDEKRGEKLREIVGGLLKDKSGTLPPRDLAAKQLYNIALDYRNHRRILNYDENGNTSFWKYDDSGEKLVWAELPVTAAYREFTLRYAKDAAAVAPDAPTIKRLYIEMLFELAAHRTAPFQPAEGDLVALQDELSKLDADVETIEQVLAEANNAKQFGAAQVAAMLLGEMGTAETLFYDNNNAVGNNVANGRNNRNNAASRTNKIRPLVAAVASPNRHVRYAALKSIMKLSPEKPYYGRSFVADAMLWFARGEGDAKIVSAAPKHTDALKIANFVSAQGYNAETATTSAEAMRLAAASPDFCFVVIDDSCKTPPPEAIVREMRNDCRTHDLPVAILTLQRNKLRDAVVQTPLEWQSLAERTSPESPFAHSLSIYYPPPQNADDMKFITDDLFFKTSTHPTAATLRLAQGREALGWIKEIVAARKAGEQSLYDFENLETVTMKALNSTTLFRQGLELAAVIRSAAMQIRLSEIASQQTLDIKLRQLAAQKFGESIERNGILLRGKQLQNLYDRYNASEQESKDSQEVLSALLNAVEKKTFKK
ncbi:MAG: hypothetical protein LBU65_11615 [Planctomycetaceae bacterium]|jgi:hypothetical protein|nr:hypothetical protein [Planctomycetaceae bacterium]